MRTFTIPTNHAAVTATRNSLYKALARIDKVTGRQLPLFVLCYHSIANDTWRFSTSLAQFKKQIAYLRTKCEIISITEFESYIAGDFQPQKPAVLLTFDDGYKDNLTIAPYLEKLGIKPVLFVLSEPKAAKTKELATKRSFLTTAEIRSLQSRGWEIGCHSATHADFSQLTPAQRTQEIITAKKVLEQRLGFTISYFAYPKGAYDASIVRTVKKAGYSLAYSMDDGHITPTTNLLAIPRIGVDRSHSFDKFITLFSPSVVKFRQVIKSLPGVAVV